MVNRVRSRAFTAVDFGLRNNGRKPNNISGAIQYNSSKPVGRRLQYILTLQEKLNNLVFDLQSPSIYFNNINTLLANQSVPTIVTTTVTPSLATYFSGRGITLTPGTPILNLATTNQSGTEVFDIQQINQINPRDNHYIYFSDTGPIQIGNTTIQITNTTPKKLRVTPNSGNPTEYDFGEEITIDGDKFQFLGSGSGGLFIYLGRNYAILNTSNTLTITPPNNPISNPNPNPIVNCNYASGFNQPNAIVIDSSRNLYVTNYGDGTISKVDTSGNITTYARGFLNPFGIAKDSAGNLYVGNASNNTVYKINIFGNVTETARGFSGPHAMVIDDSSNNLYVCNWFTGIISKVDTNRNVTNYASGFATPSGITIDSSGNLYVCNYGNGIISKVDTSRNITTYATGFNQPIGITIDSSRNLYVCNYGSGVVSKVDTNRNVTTYTPVGGPYGIAIDSSRNLYVTNYLDNKVCKIDPPSPDTTVNNIDGCALDSLGNFVYVCDYGNNRVLKYDGSGTLISAFDIGFNNPRGVAVDSNNNVYVTNYDGNSISKIDTAGIVTEVYTSIEKPYGIYFKNNKFYVSCDGSIEILDLNTTTGVIGSFDSITATFNNDSKLRGIVLDTTNNIYVVLQNANRILKINSSNEVSTYYSTANNPSGLINGLAIDSSNNLYVANAGNNTILKITSLNTNSHFFTNRILSPQGLAIKSGTLYITTKSESVVQTISLNTLNGIQTNELTQLGFPLNGKIKWICPNNRYSQDEFYVLINIFEDNIQNRHVIYRCSISKQSAIYTKICDYEFGQYNMQVNFWRDYERVDDQLTCCMRLEKDESSRPPKKIVPYSQWGNAYINNLGNACGTVYVRGDKRRNEREDRFCGRSFRCFVSYLKNGFNQRTQNYYSDYTFNSGGEAFFPEIYIPSNQPPNIRNRTTPRCMITDKQGNIYITNYGNAEDKDLPSVYKINIKGNSIVSVYDGTYDDGFYGIELINNDRFLCISNTKKNEIILLDLTAKFITVESDGITPKLPTAPVYYKYTSINSPTLISINKSNDFIYVLNNSQRDISIINTTIPMSNNISSFYTISNNTIDFFVKMSINENAYYIQGDRKNISLIDSSRSQTILMELASSSLSNCILDSNNSNLYIVQSDVSLIRLSFLSRILINKLPVLDKKQGFLPIITESYNNTLVTTFAGSGIQEFRDGNGINASFNIPYGVVLDSNNNLFVADTGNNCIRKITPQGVVTIFAGNGTAGGGFADGINTIARFNLPMGIAIDSNNNLYVADYFTSIIRKITPQGGVTTFAGDRTIGFADGIGTNARFYNPRGVAVDSNDNVYVADTENNCIRKITPQGAVSIFAGGVRQAGFTDGIGTNARFNNPRGVAVDSFDNIFVADHYNHLIRKITPQGEVTTFAGNRIEGFVNGFRTNSRFNHPISIAIDSNDNLYVSDYNNNEIRKITPDGEVSTYPTSSMVGFADGINTIAKTNRPIGIVIDSDDNVYLADTQNHRIRKINYSKDTEIIIGDSNLNTIIKYILESNTKVVLGYNNIFDNPKGIVKDSLGNIYVLSIGDKTIYKLDAIDGNITNYAINLPSPNGGITISSDASIYITNIDNTITKIDTYGVASTYIGNTYGLICPTDIVIDKDDSNIYILDKYKKIIYKNSIGTNLLTEFVISLPPFTSGLAIDSSNNLYFLNQTVNSIGKVNATGILTSSFITGIINATDIYCEEDKLYVLTIQRKYYLIDLSVSPPLSTLRLLNTETYIPTSTSYSDTITITQPVPIPDGTEYINFVLIGGGGSGGPTKGGGSGAQLKFRIKVGSNDISGTYIPFKNRRQFTFEVGRGGGIGSVNGGDTKINFFNTDGSASQPDLIDIFVAGGGKTSYGGTGKGGIFPTIGDGLSEDLMFINTQNSPNRYLTVFNTELNRYVLQPTQVNEGAGGEMYNFVDLIGSMTGNEGLESDNLFNIDGLGGDLNNTILELDPNNTQLGPSNVLNANFKKLPTPSSSNIFNLGLYPPGKGADSNMSGNDGLVAWFFEGPSQYSFNALDPGFRVPLSLMNQKFDTNWFTLPFKPDSAIISTVDQNNSNNTTATFLCDTDGNITLVNGGSGYSAGVSGVPGPGEVKIKRSENSIFNSGDDILIIVTSVGVNGNILTWSLYPGLVNGPTRDYKLYDITVPDGVTKVDVAMIGSGGTAGAFIREPLITVTRNLDFTIIVKFTYTFTVTHNRDVSWVYKDFPDEGTKTSVKENFVHFYIPAGNYTYTEFITLINSPIKNNYYRLVDQTLAFSFQNITPEDFSSPTRAVYGFVLDNPVVFQNFSESALDGIGIVKYTETRQQSYSMQFFIRNQSQADPNILYSYDVPNGTFGPIHTYTTGLYDVDGTQIYTPDSKPINDLGGGRTLKRISFPLRLMGNNPDFTANYLTDDFSIQPLPSFDGGDGSSGQYIRTNLIVNSGDILQVKVGRYHPGPIINPRVLGNSNIFSMGSQGGINGNESYIQFGNNGSSRRTASGGIAGLPNPKKTYAGKPELPPNSFVYPTAGLPPGWQKGYGAGGRTVRDTNQYDNPILRSSHGCVMIKFS